jgi:hypothetical protein
MKCISNIGKNIFILAKATQVSDVAHGPLVLHPSQEFFYVYRSVTITGEGL